MPETLVRPGGQYGVEQSLGDLLALNTSAAMGRVAPHYPGPIAPMPMQGNIPVGAPPAVALPPVEAQREPVPEDRADADDSSWIERNGHIIAGLLSAGMGVVNGDAGGAAVARGMKGMSAYYAGKRALEERDVKMAQERERLAGAETERAQQTEAYEYERSRRPVVEATQNLTLEEAQAKLAQLQQSARVMTDERARRIADLDIQKTQAEIARLLAERDYANAGAKARASGASALNHIFPGMNEQSYKLAANAAAANTPLDDNGDPVWDPTGATAISYEILKHQPGHKFVPIDAEQVFSELKRARAADIAWAANPDNKGKFRAETFLNNYRRRANVVYGEREFATWYKQFTGQGPQQRPPATSTTAQAAAKAGGGQFEKSADAFDRRNANTPEAVNERALRGVFGGEPNPVPQAEPTVVADPNQILVEAGNVVNNSLADRQTRDATRARLSMLIQSDDATPKQKEQAARLIKRMK